MINTFFRNNIFFLILTLTIISLNSLSIIATFDLNNLSNIAITAEDKVYNGLIITVGEFTNSTHEHQYLIKLKVAKYYILQMNLHFKNGSFSLHIGNNQNDNQTLLRNLDDPMGYIGNKHIIEFHFNPEYDDVYEILASTLSN